MGQKNTITRRWARRKTRPRAPHDRRTIWASIFGAICPAKGKGASLVMPWCDTQAMTEHLKEISATVDPGAHAVLMLDQAGRHGSAKPVVPANITLLPLPPRSPELNPVENVWQFMRDNWLSNRVFALPSTRELRVLDFLEVVPAGCVAIHIIDDNFAPHISAGELTVIDITDKAPQLGGTVRPDDPHAGWRPAHHRSTLPGPNLPS